VIAVDGTEIARVTAAVEGRRGQDPDEYTGYRDRARSQLFVAMTRARDLLYVLSTGDPAGNVAAAVGHFELVTSDG
jgi:hypothetical protein